ncbi:hypothetical protein KR75_27595 [Klebsiella variicola]|nr:hypothetical protein KR75_27595 [Klebsiella variicola]
MCAIAPIPTTYFLVWQIALRIRIIPRRYPGRMQWRLLRNSINERVQPVIDYRQKLNGNMQLVQVVQHVIFLVMTLLR